MGKAHHRSCFDAIFRFPPEVDWMKLGFGLFECRNLSKTPSTSVADNLGFVAVQGQITFCFLGAVFLMSLSMLNIIFYNILKKSRLTSRSYLPLGVRRADNILIDKPEYFHVLIFVTCGDKYNSYPLRSCFIVSNSS